MGILYSSLDCDGNVKSLQRECEEFTNIGCDRSLFMNLIFFLGLQQECKDSMRQKSFYDFYILPCNNSNFRDLFLFINIKAMFGWWDRICISQDMIFNEI